jgi:hypothetical protein
MQRNVFLQYLVGLGACPLMLANASVHAGNPALKSDNSAGEPTFIENWLSDLLNTMDKTLDRNTQEKLLAGCGRGCFDRHSFKQEIAAKGKGDIDELLNAYHQFFEAWIEEDKFHIRFGETSSRCYCPVVQNIKPKPNDIHCECTRATQQAILETALGKPVKVDIVETLRRGGKTCHFVADYQA